MKIDMEILRRGFHIGDRVLVETYDRYGEGTRVGIICGWSWTGRNYSDSDDLPTLDLVASVRFSKRDGSGEYCREFCVENLERA